MKLAVLISGHGSNLQALIDAADSYQVCAVISNQRQAYGLQRARDADIPAHILTHDDFDSRAQFDAALTDLLTRYQPQLIALAGFMRVLGAAFVARHAGRVLNVHPSLLPRHPGLDTHQRALAAGDSEHGASIHFVTAELDAGPVIAQGRTDVRADDTPATLAERVHVIEHRIYPAVVRWYAQGRLRCDEDGPRFDGAPLREPLAA